MKIKSGEINLTRVKMYNRSCSQTRLVYVSILISDLTNHSLILPRSNHHAMPVEIDHVYISITF